MAVISIREYEQMGDSSGGALQVAREPAVAAQSLAVGGGSVASNAFNVRCRYIRVQTDVRCSLDFGAAPTATATSCTLAAGATEYFAVTAGHKVAVIAA